MSGSYREGVHFSPQIQLCKNCNFISRAEPKCHHRVTKTGPDNEPCPHARPPSLGVWDLAGSQAWTGQVYISSVTIIIPNSQWHLQRNLSFCLASSFVPKPPVVPSVLSLDLCGLSASSVILRGTEKTVEPPGFAALGLPHGGSPRASGCPVF